MHRTVYCTFMPLGVLYTRSKKFFFLLFKHLSRVERGARIRNMLECDAMRMAEIHLWKSKSQHLQSAAAMLINYYFWVTHFYERNITKTLQSLRSTPHVWHSTHSNATFWDKFTFMNKSGRVKEYAIFMHNLHISAAIFRGNFSNFGMRQSSFVMSASFMMTMMMHFAITMCCYMAL